jgi:hypothetical protein
MRSSPSPARQARLLAAAREIVESFGPRPAGSPAEAQTAEYIRDRFQAAGLEVSMQPVEVSTRSHLAQIIGYLLLVVSAISLTYSAPLAAATALAGVAILATEAAAIPAVSRLLPRSRSHNIVGRRGARQSPLRTVVFLAHLDTAQPTLFSAPRAVLIQRQSFLFALNAGVILLVLAVMAIFTDLSGLVWIGFAAGLYLIFHLGVLVHGVLNLPASPGANDDASGLAALIELAGTLPALEQTDAWFVATAGHETGMAGTHAFLASSGLRPASTLLVNLDSIGSGTVTLSMVEGQVRSVPVPRKVLGMAGDVVAALDLPVQARPHQETNSAAYLALRSGMPAITIYGLDRRGAIPNWHWTSDRPDRLEPSTMEVATQLASGLALKLDEELAAASRQRMEG